MNADALVIDEMLRWATDPTNREDFLALARRLDPPRWLMDQRAAGIRHAQELAQRLSGADASDGVPIDQHARVPEWLRLDFACTLASWLKDEGRTCMHQPAWAGTTPVFAAAWKPGVVVCTQCVHLLSVARTEADRTCDRCGLVTEPSGSGGEGIHPCRLTILHVVYMYGLCPACEQDHSEHWRAQR